MEEMEKFVKAFAEQFDETPLEMFAPQTVFHELDDWSSINGLAILNMISRLYQVKLSPEELRQAVTVQDVYELIKSKK